MGPGTQAERVDGVTLSSVRGAKDVSVRVEQHLEGVVPVHDAVAAIAEEHVPPYLFAGASRRSVVLQSGKKNRRLGRMLRNESGAKRRKAGIARFEFPPPVGFILTKTPPSVPVQRVLESLGECKSACTSACAFWPMDVEAIEKAVPLGETSQRQIDPGKGSALKKSPPR